MIAHAIAHVESEPSSVSHSNAKENRPGSFGRARFATLCAIEADSRERRRGAPDTAAGRVGELCRMAGNYRSISPITMSNEPTIAGMSAIRQPRHRSLVTDRLQNELLRARTRHGIASPLLTM